MSSINIHKNHPAEILRTLQLAIPVGSEDLCRAFYVTVLGWEEVPKPESLAGRGGVWFCTDSFRIHLGVEKDFRPAKKAHPAFLLDDLDIFKSEEYVKSFLGINPNDHKIKD